MKKTKLIGLAALMLALGVVGCGDQPGDDPGDNPGEQECSHDWSDWKSDATKHWKECTKCGEKKSEKDHSYSSVAKDQTGVTRATCIAAGQVKKACTCGAETIVAEDATGHTMQELGADAAGYVAATCSQAGTMPRKCKDCEVTDTVEIPVTDHNYVAVEEADAAIVATSGKVAKAATCDEGGVELSICHGCNDVKETAVAKLGHSMITNDTAEPAAGKAAVRVYECEHGCGKTELGFKASEVTEESKNHLTIGTDGGASFWGRPIGNNLELDEDGTSVNQEVGELVFDDTQTGDFFEYKFDLNATQAASLGNCKLYCDAKPSNYMGSNGVDFWAYGADSSDWTPGAYIDGERKGELVDDFRYVLYVDGVRKDLDATVKTPVPSGDPRGEYALPYTFSLHEGENTIRLVMSGGYRSTFYNFIFRAIEEEQPGGDDPVVTHTHEFAFGEADTGSETVCAKSVGCCKGCNKEAIKIASGADLNGNLKQDDKLGKGTSGSYDGTKISKYVFNAPAGAGEIYAEAAYDSKGNDARSYYDGKDGSSNAFPLADGKTNTVMTLNSENVTLPTKTYGELGLGSTENVFGLIKIADATFVEGANEFTMTATSSYGLKYRSLIFVTNNDHAHNFVYGELQGTAGAGQYKVGSCFCGKNAIAVDALSGVLTGSNKNGTPEGFLKLGSNGNNVSVTFDVAEAKNAVLYFECMMDGYSSNGSTTSGNATKKLINFTVKVNGDAVTTENQKTFGEMLGYTADPANGSDSNGGRSAIGLVEYASVSLTAGSNTILFQRDGSYNPLIRNFVFIY